MDINSSISDSDRMEEVMEEVIPNSNVNNLLNIQVGSADYLITQKLQKSTTASYVSILKMLQAFLVEHPEHGKYVVDGNIRYKTIHDTSADAGDYLSEKAIEDFIMSKTTKRCGEMPTANTLKRYRTAIKTKQKFDDKFWERLSDIFKGYKSVIKQAKSSGQMSSKEGKDSINESSYKVLAKALFNDKYTEFHAYVVLTWNLICRGDTTASINIDHLSWNEDCLLVCCI